MTTQQTQIVALKSYLKTRLEEWTQGKHGPLDYIPLCLANTLREVEWLENKMSFLPRSLVSDADWNKGYNALLAAFQQSAEIRLNEILDAFKKVLG